MKPTQHDLNTNPNDITTTPFVKKLQHQTYHLFLEQKHPQTFIFQSHKFTSPFSYHSYYFLNHLFTIGTIRNYDPVKQYYILTSYHDPTRPFFVPQETFNVNDDFLLPTHIPTAVPNFFPKMNKLEKTPLDNHSRSLYTVFVHIHHSLAQLKFIIAKLSSFILKKQYNSFPSTKKISMKLFNLFQLFLLLHSFTRPLLPIYSKLQTPRCVKYPSLVLLIKLLAKS